VFLPNDLDDPVASGREDGVITLRNGGHLATVADTGPPNSLAFEEFYAAHFQSLTVQLFAYAGDLTAAQDVVQDAFCKAFTRWNRVSRLDDPAGWVHRVAWNLATSRWRKARIAATFVQRHREEHTPEPSPDRVALARALSVLPPRHRRAVILYYLADLPVAEIARQEGVAEGTIKSWLYRGRTALATQFTDEENSRD
jgi:RNA polymerase sigma-70 factor (ECF subfamily)